jgi:hypothetical protein
MSKFFRKDEIFEYEGELYNYSTLRELRNKSKGVSFKDGDVQNIETGGINDISSIENFYSEAMIIDITDKLVDSSTLSGNDIRDINRKVVTKEHKDFFDDVKSRMESGKASYEETMQYWDLKKLFKDIEYKYDFNNFIKMNNNEESINLLGKFSFINRGRIIELVRLVSGKRFNENDIFISREDLLSLLQFETKDGLRHFLASLESQEIICRKNKRKRNTIEFTINPFIFNRIQKVRLTSQLYEMFPNSFKNFLTVDIYYYFKMISENEHLKFEILDELNG